MREEKTMVSDAHALDWREVLGRNRAVVSWLYHIVEHGWFISAVESIHGSYGIPTALNGQHARWSSENWSLIEIFMEVTTRDQYFKQTSLSPVWRLYLPVSYVTMLKLHSAECIHDEVVWFWHCVCYLDGWLMSVWEFVHTIIPVAFGVLYRNSCQEAMEDLEMWDCTAVSSMVGFEARVLCYCATDDVSFSSLHFFMVLIHCLLYHRDQRFLSAVVLNLRRCRVMSSHYSLLSPSLKYCIRQS